MPLESNSCTKRVSNRELRRCWVLRLTCSLRLLRSAPAENNTARKTHF